jgi:hypothetical protein
LFGFFFSGLAQKQLRPSGTFFSAKLPANFHKK